MPASDDGSTVTIESSGPQKKSGSQYTLDRDVVITYKDRRIEADHIDYDSDTGELNASGHLKVSGGENNETISASRGSMNLKSQTGRFFDVKGSVGLRGGRKPIYDNGQPFLFEGKVVVKTGPKDYDIYEGSVTSCQLPRPDWQLFAGKFSVTSERATARNSVFRIMDVPLVYLPYVTHPVGGDQRQSGFMIPVIGQSSTKGFILGEQYYLVLNRSADMTVGAEYFSERGWAQSATFRYRGLGNNFAVAYYSGLLDRGFYTGGQYVNQGGQDVVFSGRYDLSPTTRFVGDVEYLSSYPYRAAFTESFNQAVSSDILSIGYVTHESGGYAWSLRTDRYQGLKRAGTPTVSEEQIRIFHAPAFDLSTTEHRLGETGFQWSAESELTSLKRVQPNFSTSGLTHRFDLHPQIAYPLSAGGWRLRPSIAVRDTIYSRSQENKTTLPPVESGDSVNRADVEVEVEGRMPVLERTFSSPLTHKLFGSDIRHTIEPAMTYRLVRGIDNFHRVLRFDDTDVVSDTNEFQYGVTQRLFIRPKNRKDKPCAAATDVAASAVWTGAAAPGMMGAVSDTVASDAGYTAAAPAGCGSRELITWRLTQKHFFDQNFGNAVVTGRRNIFETTMALSGIAFLTEPRAISPLISRLRWKTSDNFDVEWDFDLDTGAKKFTGNNLLVNFHEGSVFSGLSYARLNAPGRFNTAGFSSSVSDFTQLRFLLGYGAPTRRGLGVAANAGLDLNRKEVQYGALQVQYNWDCCGFSVEYRKYELGAVRNENVYRFNFTLANIGTAGNLRRAERLF